MIDKLAPVLLLEDSLEDFEAISRAFKKENIYHPLKHVMRAEDGLEYLRSQELPRLFLFDVNMAGMCGLEFLKIIRSLELTKDIPAIVLTCSDDSPDLRACHMHGANAYILKSAHLGTLANSLRKMKEFLLDTVDVHAHRNGSGEKMELSIFEIETLTWIAKGKNSQETADILNVSEIVVKTRLEICRDKLGALNTMHTISIALQKGLLFFGL